MQELSSIHKQSEKQVFLSGSRSFVALTDEVYESLQKIIQQGLGIVLGDASQGGDAVVASFCVRCSILMWRSIR